MAQRDTSVNLVIRARNEADRAINTVADALNGLLETAAGGESKLGALATSLASVDKAAATIQGAATKGEQAFNALGNTVKARRADLEALKDQARAAAAEIARLNGGEAIVGAGRDQGPRLAQLQTVQAAYQKLQGEITRLSGSIAADEGRLNNSRSALQQLGSTAIAASEGQAKLRAEIELQTAALNAQAEAAGRITPIQARINAVTGVNRPATFDGVAAGASAAILVEAAARDELIQKYRQQAAEARALAEAEATEQANRARFGITENPKGAVASQSAAVFTEAANAAEAQAAAIRDAATAEDALNAKAQQLRASLNPMAGLQESFNVKLRDANQLYATGKISAAELTAATTKLNAELKRAEVDMKRNGGSSIGLFGLRPYELTNLGYQLNDVVTQLASGTSLSQTLAQQGGQILQLLPNIGSKLLALAQNPFFLVTGAALAVIATGFKEISDRAERLRGFESLLSRIANGAEYSAAALEKNVEALKLYGVAADDASAALKVFVSEGISSERFEQFGRTAKNMADTLGIKVPEAAKQLADAFTGDYAAIVKLDDATNFLTASQREHIRTLFEEGNAQAARAEALQIITGKMDEAAAKIKGPWTDAIRSLGRAWQSFLELLRDNPFINRAAEALGVLADAANDTLRRLNAVGLEANKIAQTDLEQRFGRNLTYKQGAKRPYSFDGDTSIAQNQIYAQAAEKLNDLIEKRVELLKRAAAEKKTEDGSPIVDEKNTPEYKRSNDTLAAMSKESEYQRLRERGSQAAENLRRSGAAFESAAEQRRRIALAGELAATKAVGDQRVKDAAAAEAREKERLAITREKDAYDKANSTAAMQARNFVMGKEGYKSNAYWDRNHYRVGYGSSTTTDAGGNVRNVTQGTTTDRESAVRDLDRRIIEFQNVIKSQIGGERFGAFGPSQQAALTSIAYNYGKLPERILGAVKTGTSEQIAAAVRSLGGDNGGINRKRRNSEADVLATPNQAIEADNTKLAIEAEQRQNKLNVSIQEANDARRDATAELTKQAALQDTALIDARIAAAGEKAVADLERRVAEQNAGLKPYEQRVELTKQQIEETRTLAVEEAAAQARRERASAALREKTDPVGELTGQRDALRQRRDYLDSQGDAAGANALSGQLDDVNAKLREAIANLQAYYAALSPQQQIDLGITDEQIAGISERLQTATDQSREWGRVLGISTETIARNITSGLVGAFDKFAQNVAEGKNVFTSLKDAFLDFAASFLRQIAQMIVQQVIFNAIKSALGGGAPTMHTGGIVGVNATTRRTVDPGIFAGAMRFHTGGIPGLGPNEVPAILERNEEVLTRSDPRHRMNGGLNPGTPASGGKTTVVNVFDAAAAMEAALQTPAGERVILNHVSNNQQAWKSALG